MKASRRILVPMVVGALCGLATWLAAQLAFFRGVEEWLQDAFFTYRGARATATRVLIVGLDEDSLEELPKPLTAISPELAEVVTYLNARKASAIGLDFQIPDRLDAYDREKDLGGKALGAAACAAGNVVLPLVLGDGGRPVPPLSSWRFCLDPDRVEFLPQLALVELAAGAGEDEVVRHHMIAGTVEGVRYDSLPLAVLQTTPRSAKPGVADDIRAPLVTTDRAGENVYVDYRPVPLDAAKRLRINYVGPPGTIPHVSFRDVLAAARAGGKAETLVDRRKRPVDLDGAIVLVGATAHSLGDYHATPYTNGTLLAGRGGPRLMSGTELLANVVATLGDRAFITTPWAFVSLPWVVLAGAVLGVAYRGMSLRQGLLLCVAHHFAWKAPALAAFCVASWRVEVGAMLTTGVVTYGTTFALRWRRLRAGMFGVVKGNLLAGLLEGGPDDPALRPVERGISVLFADIRGFTRWSHAHTPTEVVALLNAYFEAIIPAVEAHGGTVDKYIGDGIMVLFGVPDERPDHAERALRAAVAVIARVHELAPTWARHDFHDFAIGVGVATGAAVVGMVGSRLRLDYTAIGDTVNAAARIESANKELGSEILISARTRNAVGPELFASLGGTGGPTAVTAHGLEGLTVYRVDVPRTKTESRRSNTALRPRGAVGVLGEPEPAADPAEPLPLGQVAPAHLDQPEIRLRGLIPARERSWTERGIERPRQRLDVPRGLPLASPQRIAGVPREPGGLGGVGRGGVHRPAERIERQRQRVAAREIPRAPRGPSVRPRPSRARGAAEVVVAREAVVLGKLRPRGARRGPVRAVTQEVSAATPVPTRPAIQRREAASRPGSSAMVASQCRGIRSWYDANSKFSRGMPRGDHVVIHLPAHGKRRGRIGRRADVASRTGANPVGKTRQRLHAAARLPLAPGGRCEVEPRPRRMLGDPVPGRPVTRLAANALAANDPGRIARWRRVAGQAPRLASRRRGPVQVRDDCRRSRGLQRLEGAGVRLVARRPDRVHPARPGWPADLRGPAVTRRRRARARPSATARRGRGRGSGRAARQSPATPARGGRGQCSAQEPDLHGWAGRWFAVDDGRTIMTAAGPPSRKPREALSTPRPGVISEQRRPRRPRARERDGNAPGRSEEPAVARRRLGAGRGGGRVVLAGMLAGGAIARRGEPSGAGVRRRGRLDLHVGDADLAAEGPPPLGPEAPARRHAALDAHSRLARPAQPAAARDARRGLPLGRHAEHRAHGTLPHRDRQRHLGPGHAAIPAAPAAPRRPWRDRLLTDRPGAARASRRGRGDSFASRAQAGESDEAFPATPPFRIPGKARPEAAVGVAEPLANPRPLAEFFADVAAPFLCPAPVYSYYQAPSGRPPRSPRVRSPLGDPATAAALFDDLRSRLGPGAGGVLDALERLCDQGRQLDRQARLHVWLHNWLAVHLPLSVAMIVLMVIHAVAALDYL